MEQVSDNILVLGPGDAIPEGTENSIKILLLGSIDTRDDHKFDWASSFIKGMIDITDPQKGLIQYQGFNFIIINSTITPPGGLVPNVMNNDFTMKMQWTFSMAAAADSIFLNFLKRSTAPLPLYWLGYTCGSGKLCVRCPEEYVNYSIVNLTCRQHGVALLPGKVGSVLSVLQSIAAFTPKFQEVLKYQLPE